VKLEDLRPNSNVNVVIRVISAGEIKNISTKKSRSLRVCEFQVGDETAIISFALFNDQIEFLKREVGNVIRIINGWTKQYRGQIQLSLGFSGRWERVNDPKFPSLEDIRYSSKLDESTKEDSKKEPKKQDMGSLTISEIIPETTFSTVVRVFHALPAKSYAKVKVKTYMVGDDTGIIPFTTFNEDRDKFKELMGEVIELKCCWPRLYNGQLEISRGYKGSYYHPKGRSINQKQAKTKLNLVPEPNNQYDSNAVAIYFKGSKVGYIPRTQNKAIFKALTEGGPEIDCTLGVFIPQNSQYTMPSKSYNPIITISTFMENVEWRPVILYPEDFITV
jgi:ssDNA-binding replication factor A large subunit